MVNNIKIRTQKKNSFLVPTLALVLLFSFSLDGKTTWLEKIPFVDGRANTAAINAAKEQCNGTVTVKTDRSHGNDDGVGETRVRCEGEKLSCRIAGKYTEGKGCSAAALEYRKVQERGEALRTAQEHIVAATGLFWAVAPPSTTQQESYKRTEERMGIALVGTTAELALNVYNLNRLKAAESKAEEAEKQLDASGTAVWKTFSDNSGGLTKDQKNAIKKATSFSELDSICRIDCAQGGTCNDSKCQASINAIKDGLGDAGVPEDLGRTRFKNYGEYEYKFLDASDEAEEVKNKIATEKGALATNAAFGALNVYIQKESIDFMKEYRKSLESPELERGERTYSLAGLQNPGEDSGALGIYGRNLDSTYDRGPNKAITTGPSEISDKINHSESKYSTAPSKYKVSKAANASGGSPSGAGPGIPNEPAEDVDNNYGEVVQYGSLSGAGLNGGPNEGSTGDGTAMEDAIKSLLGKNGEEKEATDGEQFFQGRGRSLASLPGYMEKEDGDTRSIFERVRAKYQDVILQGIL